MNTVRESWRRIEQWLRSEAPDLSKHLPPPVNDVALEELTQKLGLSLPEDLRESYLVHNGADYGPREISLFPPQLASEMDLAFCLLPIKNISKERRIWIELLERGELDTHTTSPDPEIGPGWWRPGWVPVAGNGAGDFICIDLSPGPGGSEGQVILSWHDRKERKLLAPSWACYLDNVATAMEDGSIRFDPDYGLVTASRS
ncbi:MAG: SMI1/KNR4 family protein [Candidatus Eremiobacteraeota bacterium]|nr:SMI1/KNR4 family protein [Candidatus Eremiobacteraeota bacterium]